MTKWMGYAGVAAGSVLATVAAGAIALSASGRLPGHAAADPNGDGKVTRAEWLAASAERFTALDTNRDGSLAVGELPRPDGRGGHRRGRHRGHHDECADGPTEGIQPSAPAQPAPATQAAAPTPAAQ